MSDDWVKVPSQPRLTSRNMFAAGPTRIVVYDDVSGAQIFSGTEGEYIDFIMAKDNAEKAENDEKFVKVEKPQPPPFTERGLLGNSIFTNNALKKMKKEMREQGGRNQNTQNKSLKKLQSMNLHDILRNLEEAKQRKEERGLGWNINKAINYNQAKKAKHAKDTVLQQLMTKHLRERAARQRWQKSLKLVRNQFPKKKFDKRHQSSIERELQKAIRTNNQSGIVRGPNSNHLRKLREEIFGAKDAGKEAEGADAEGADAEGAKDAGKEAEGAEAEGASASYWFSPGPFLKEYMGTKVQQKWGKKGGRRSKKKKKRLSKKQKKILRRSKRHSKRRSKRKV